MSKNKSNSKSNFSVRVSLGNLGRVDKFVKKMGRVKADVFREALEIGLSFMEWPEYYAVRLSGKPLPSMMQEVRKTLKKLAKP